MPTDGTDRTDADESGDGSGEDGDGGGGGSAAEPSPERVVEVAAEAAEEVVFSRLDAGEVDDLDVTTSFEDGRLEVDVYVNAPDAAADERRVADDAAMAARAAVDDLF